VDLKWIGAVLCFCISVAVGWTAGRNEKERTAQCEAFVEFFAYIQNQVGYFLAPTKLMYKNFRHDVLQKTGFLDALCAHENDEVYFDVWKRALNDCKDGLKLSEAQYEIVYAFGSCIGKSNEALQLKHLEYYSRAMRTATEKQKAQMQKNIKLYRTLGFSVGAAILILVI
jgi:stage III sporulation protein AB